MNVSLTPELEKFVHSKVENGRYNSASEVVREALRLLEEYDKSLVAQLRAFDEEIGARLIALDQGDFVAGHEARARLRRRSQRRQRSA